MNKFGHILKRLNSLKLICTQEPTFYVNSKCEFCMTDCIYSPEFLEFIDWFRSYFEEMNIKIEDEEISNDIFKVATVFILAQIEDVKEYSEAKCLKFLYVYIYSHEIWPQLWLLETKSGMLKEVLKRLIDLQSPNHCLKG